MSTVNEATVILRAVYVAQCRLRAAEVILASQTDETGLFDIRPPAAQAEIESARAALRDAQAKVTPEIETLADVCLLVSLAADEGGK